MGKYVDENIGTMVLIVLKQMIGDGTVKSFNLQY